MVRFGMVAAALAIMASPLLAQESTEDLKRELEQLRKEVDGLKAVNTTREIPANGKLDVEAMGAAMSPIETLFKGTILSGLIDTAWGFSFNQLTSDINVPEAGFGNNPLRFTDNSDHAFYLHNVVLQLERLATKDMIVGYHIELHAGHDPQVLEGSALALQEGWIQILIPAGPNGLDIRVGKMATIVGYEVVENTNNLNYSRGALFNLVEPITSTGVRAMMAFVEQFSVTVGFSNGMNFQSSGNELFFDENHGKAFELQAMLKPIKDLMIALNMIVGNDTTISASTHDRFYIFNIVVAFTMDKLTLAMNFDQASAEGVGNQAPPPNARAPFRGIAVYGKYQVTDVFATGARIEYVSDISGTAVGAAAAGDSGIGARIITLTLTQEFKVAQHLIVRVEFRHDSSNQHNFVRNDGRAARGDNTLAFEALLPF